jgi:hypothetical protein
METKKERPKDFDPFAGLPDLSASSRSWLLATIFQSLITCGLLLLARYARGKAWERHADAIVILGIVATWSLLLRTIRERLIQLMRHWQAYSKGLIRKASQSGQHLIAVKLTNHQEKFIKGSIWRLRIIAAGLTIPFFVMPLMWSGIAVVFSFKLGPDGARDFWNAAAFFTLFAAAVVFGYFRWAIVPMPKPVRVFGHQRGVFRKRKRRGM